MNSNQYNQSFPEPAYNMKKRSSTMEDPPGNSFGMLAVPPSPVIR